jgi:beta-glucanase (GH16 family)
MSGFVSPPALAWLRALRIDLGVETEKEPSASHLSLRVYRDSHFSSTAEIASLQRNVFHASIRISARVRGDSGAVAGMFTYMNDSTESDIEILTRDRTNLVHYTNQPTADPDGVTIPAATSALTLPEGLLWTDWNVHRLDWTPWVSAWYINGVHLVNKTYGIPQFPSYLTLNMVCASFGNPSRSWL